MEATILEARNIVRRFGTFTALDGVDFDVRAGEVHALLGENGAGKSTLMNLLSGLLAPSEGELRLQGKPTRFRSPTDAAASGIGMVHQHFLLVPTVSVAENLLLGAPSKAGGPLSYPLASVVSEAKAIADRLGWTIPWGALAGELPVGTQQRIEILKALRGQTRVLIFDEPTAVLTPIETPELFATIGRLATEGRGIVFISHKLDEVLALSDRVTVLRRGKVVFTTRTADTNAAELAEAMVGKGSEAAGLLAGRSTSERPPQPPNNGGSTAVTTVVSDSDPKLPPLLGGWGGKSGLTITKLTLRRPRSPRPAIDDLTFSVAPGEIFGIAGVDGNGQEELAALLSGLERPTSGSIAVGAAAPAPGPAAFRRAGVAVIPADRQTRGLAMPLTITENVTLGVYDDTEYRRGPLLLWPALKTHAASLIRRFDIRATGPESPVSALSGGNQQKVVIARALSGNPSVIVAVNPTRGLDVGAIAYVHAALRKAQAEGAAIVLISTELSEVLALASRVAVLFEGRFTGIVPPSTPREEIGLLMGGTVGAKPQ